MAVITNYETLQTAIADYASRSDLGGFTPNFVQTAEDEFYSQPLNWGPWMESALSLTMASGVAPLPTDYLGLKWAALSDSPNRQLQRKSAQQLYMHFPRNGATGKPYWIARDQGSFVFGPKPDSDYTVIGTYYARPTPLRSDGDGSNWLIEKMPNLLLYRCMIEAEIFLKNDSRVAMWRDLYADQLVNYRDQIKNEDTMGGPMTASLA